MNIVQRFAEYLEGIGVATLGQDMIISRAVSTGSYDEDGTEIPENIWWLRANGSGPSVKTIDGRVTKSQSIEINYRDRDASCVYEKMSQLSDDLDCAGCVVLTGYEVVEVETTGPFTDNDIDNEERTVGLLIVNITFYKECNNGIS